MNTRFTVKGVNDDTDTCECCGKQGLKKVVWIEDAETGAINAFGTTCALAPAKLFGCDREIKRAVAGFVRDEKEKARQAKNAEIKRVSKLRMEWMEKEYVARGGKYETKPNRNWRPGMEGVWKTLTIPADSELMETVRIESKTANVEAPAKPLVQGELFAA